MLLRLLILMLILVAVAYGYGVRFHVEAFQDYIDELVRNNYKKFYMSESDFVVGKLISETKDDVVIRMGKGTATFPKSKIIKVEELRPDESYTSWIPRGSGKPILTRRREDSIIPQLEIFSKKLSSEMASGNQSALVQNAVQKIAGNLSTDGKQ